MHLSHVNNNNNKKDNECTIIEHQSTKYNNDFICNTGK